MSALGSAIRSACEAAASFLGGFVGVRGAGAITTAPAAHRCGADHGSSNEETTPASIRRQLTARAAQRRSCC